MTTQPRHIAEEKRGADHRRARRVSRGMVTLTMLVAMAAVPAAADEGMWLPHELDRAPVGQWRSRGLEMDAKGLYNPKRADVTDAVVLLGGGTGTFVSSRGLIVTNHHVAEGALQRNSTVEKNYLEEGFFAANLGEEIPALGYDAYVLTGVREVTDDVLKSVKKGMDPAERYKAIEIAQKKIVEKAEEGSEVHADVKSVFGGSEYYLYEYLKIRDIRIVYAPPNGIGVYGGDIDNWMWPRHTGDFAFLRAYVAPDGAGAAYSEDNVPYRPAKYLSFSTGALSAGDFTMVIGYPARTLRHRSYYAVDYAISQYYPRGVARYEALLKIMEDESARDPDAKIKLAASVRGWNNYYKNFQGMLEGLVKHDLVGRKQKEEQELREFIASDPGIARDYGDLFDKLAEQFTGTEEAWAQEGNLKWMLYATNALRSAYTIYNWSVEKEKSDEERDARYMPRDEEGLQRRLALADRRYFEAADKRVVAYFIKQMATIGSGPRPAPVRDVCGELEGEDLDEAIAAFVDVLYEKTAVTDEETRLAMFGEDVATLRARNDPMIDFAAALEAEAERMEKVRNAFEGAMQELRPRLIALRSLHQGGIIYPDANRTMRISIGEIKGYSPRDAVTYGFQTTLSGVVEKHTGEEPFDCPKRLVELHQAKDYGAYVDPVAKDVPVCFLSTDDVTGGSSGSAVLNGKGEIIGLAFDGNYEAISADWQFVDFTRCINVDSRYILFVVDKYSGARALLEELTVEHHAQRM